MHTFRLAVNVPLALLAGAALASNPRLFPPGNNDAREGVSAVQTARTSVASPEQDEAPLPEVVRGPESPELLALRMAEDQLLAGTSLAPLPSTADLDAEFDDQRSTEFGADFLDGLTKPDIPIEGHPVVERYINYFTKHTKGRELFGTWLERSGRYRPVISEALRSHGVPRDLEALVWVESGFWPTAKSKAGAVGLWQFMPTTARAYGLTVTDEYDERRSIWRASDAAAQHLSDLHSRFSSWDLALAAYNYGYANVERRLAAAGESNFWNVVDVEGVLPEETRKYVPKVLAVAVVLNNLDHFGFADTQVDAPLRGTGFEVPPGTTLSTLARAAGTTVSALQQLNPELLTAAVPDRGAPIIIHLPNDGLARARVMLPRLLGAEVNEADRYPEDHFEWLDPGAPKGGNGDARSRLERTLTRSIERTPLPLHADVPARVAPTSGAHAPVNEPALTARMTPVAKPARAETAAGRSAERVKAEVLYSIEPDASQLASVAPASATTTIGAPTGTAAVPADTSEPTFRDYKVQRGDTLAKLAFHFRVGQREIAFDNRIRDWSLVYSGQTLRIRDVEKSPARANLVYRVRTGDSLSKIAERSQESEARLAESNRLQNPNRLQVGQILLIPLEG